MFSEVENERHRKSVEEFKKHEDRLSFNLNEKKWKNIINTR